MAQLDDLEFRITASMGDLTTALNRGQAQVGQFANQASGSFNRIDTAVGKSVRSMRQFLGFFGVGFGVNALRNWVTNAVRAAQAAGQQSEEIRQLSLQMRELKASSDALAISVGSRLVPAMDGLAGMLGGLRRQFDPTVLETYNKRVADTRKEIELLQTSIDINRRGKRVGGLLGGLLGDDAMDEGLTRMLQRMEQLRMNLRALEAAAPRNAPPILDGLQEMGAGVKLPADFKKMPDFVRQMQDLQLSQDERRPPEIQMPADLLRMPNFAKQVEEMNAAWEEHNKQMDEAKRKQENFASAFAATFESRGMDALVSGRLGDAVKGFIADLGQLIVRMLVLQPLGEAIAGAFSGGATTFFSGLFSRATGGDVSGGQVYRVHPGEAFFSPGMSGRVAGAGAGGGITVVNNIDARGADPSVAARLPAILAENNQRVKAEIRHEMGRRR